MDTTIINDPSRRHDFAMIFEVTDGNPNGDPDAGGMPRIDPETMQGLVTDVALKRKVRNYVAVAREGQAGDSIYINDGGIALNAIHEAAYVAESLKSTGAKQRREDVDIARNHMCREFYDVRMFGAVMTTGVNCGQVRGPIQLTFSRSVDPIVPLDIAITRVAITRKEDADVVVADDGSTDKKQGKTTEMGRKSIVPYGLYVGYGFFSPAFAGKNGVTADDLALFWEALQGMWALDRSAARGLMGLRGLYVFSHENRLGNASAESLFDRVDVHRAGGVEAPRRFKDYVVTVDDSALPDGVALSRVIG